MILIINDISERYQNNREVMPDTPSQSLVDKFNAIKIWMKETEEAVSSQDSYKEDALSPEGIDLILEYFMEVQQTRSALISGSSEIERLRWKRRAMSHLTELREKILADFT